jgi:hypothetical protein
VSDFLLFHGMIAYDEQFAGAKQNVEEMAPYVDYVILVVEKQRPFTEEQKKELLKYPNVILLELPFEDNIPSFRNKYLDKAKEIMKQQNKPGWIAVLDTDEHFCKELRENLRKIIAEYDAKNYTQLGVRCLEGFEVHDWMDDIDKLKESATNLKQSSYFKSLIFRICCDQLHYAGIGNPPNAVHEWWGCPVHPWKPIYLPPHLTYSHIKSSLTIWRNSARNVYLNGGGNNLGDKVPEWVELRSICNALGISCWREYEAYLKRGNVDPLLKKFLIKCLEMPRTDYGVEYRQMSLFYWSLHRDELTPEILYKIKNPPKMTPEQEVEWYVISQYRYVLGREPDDAGRRHYTQAILEGKIRREDLSRILMMSDEYKEKFNIDETVQWVINAYRQVLKRDPDEEGLRVYVDHIVKGRINKEDLPRILMESNEYRSRFGGRS